MRHDVDSDPDRAALAWTRIAGALRRLTIGTVELEVAKLPRVPPNSPVAEVRRVFAMADRKVIHLAKVTYRGDFVRIEMDLRP
ncbi:hypothetical protein [Rhodopseudomonas palustris]|uniref:hypothetical protein n=1 Tax=Rhodopseudomonas palustris TaxID=1076 RepID=UPI0016044315|nr:hypothetical protein [Rhodopseudomonas palustris]